MGITTDIDWLKNVIKTEGDQQENGCHTLLVDDCDIRWTYWDDDNCGYTKQVTELRIDKNDNISIVWDDGYVESLDAVNYDDNGHNLAEYILETVGIYF